MGGSTERRAGLEDLPFSYRTSSDGKVFVSWRGKQVMILKGSRARSFLNRMAGKNEADRQLVLAKITGNFKRGNEGS